MVYKIFISQPMSGRTESEISAERDWITNLMNQIGNGLSDRGIAVEIIESFERKYLNSGVNPLIPLSCCIQKLSEADIVVFAPGWKKSRGCRVEHTCAKEYGISIIELPRNYTQEPSRNNDTKT